MSPRVNSPVVRAKELRKTNKTIRTLNRELKTDNLLIDDNLYVELEAYLNSPPVIPRHISASRKRDVKAAQEALQQLDSYQHRVAAVQFSVTKVLQALSRVETIVRSVLLKEDFITSSMTKQGSKDRITLVCPLLAQKKADWEGLDKLCQIVHSHLGDSKDSLKQQIKLDDNARWANKISP